MISLKGDAKHETFTERVPLTYIIEQKEQRKKIVEIIQLHVEVCLWICKGRINERSL